MRVILILISLGVLLSVILSAWGLIERNSMKNYMDQQSRTIEQIQANFKALESGSNRPVEADNQPESVKISIDDDPVKGNPSAPVTIVEFSDYECPFCRRHFDSVFSKIDQEYISNGKVRYVFRDFPLPFHEKAVTAAIAANCAGEQGKYWEFHDFLFRSKDNLDMQSMSDFARQLELDETKFGDCVKDNAKESEIAMDFEEGKKYGVKGTPSFFIGNTKDGKEFTGIMIRGAQPYSVFKNHIDEQLMEIN
ncbi:MAG: DsbA family protein [Flavobacteriaceae bacterium]|nr:DsbA family protein [Flavobacteriaceae bacterium]